MIIISKINNSIYECIGNQKYNSWIDYREFTYVLKKEVDDGVIWYNTFSREIILLSHSDINILYTNEKIKKELVQKWFLVPNDIDDKTIVYSFWQNYSMKHPLRKNSPLALATIFTTTECNAKCPYCYEYGTSKNTMNVEIANATADYIIRNMGHELTLKWFGGEPLLNQNAIDIISSKIKNTGINYSGYMVTNAYLLDEVEDEKIKELWKIRQIQITIDGTKNNYLRIKGLPNDSYEKALNNIERLASMGINVMIRTHVTNDNYSDIKDLIIELSERYKNLKNKRNFIRLYAAPLFENLGNTPPDLSGDKRNKLYNNYIEIDKLISKSGIDHGRWIPSVQQSHCMADSCCSIVIAPDGNLTPCEHCHDKEIIGNVIEGGRIPDKWFERTSPIPECKSCFYYPQCLKLKMCEAESPCNEEHRRFIKHQSEQVIENMYNNFKLQMGKNAKSFRNR